MHLHHRLDWIALTVKTISIGETEQYAVYVASPGEAVVWGDAAPPRHYKQATRERTGILAAQGSDHMGGHIDIPGSAITERQLQAAPTLTRALEVGRITRLDLAIDILDPQSSVEDVGTAIANGDLSTGRKKVEERRSKGDGHTLYIGARTSDFMARIYNKAAEQKAKGNTTGNWVRYEIELHGKAANFATQAILQASLWDVTVSLMRKAIRPVEGHLLPKDVERIFSAETKHIEVQTSERKTTKTREWLLGTVARTLAKLAKIDPHILEEMDEMVGYYMQNE